MPPSRVMDSYAENALETAVRLREAGAVDRIVALAVEDEEADDVLRKAYALGADEAVRVWDPGWTEADGLAVARILAPAIRSVGAWDLVVCGREASDVEEGVVGPALAELLSVPCITIARSVTVEGGRLRAEREVDGMVQTVEGRPPLVVTVTSSDANAPRMPKVRDRMLARGKKIRVLTADEIGMDSGRGSPRTRLRRLRKPASGKGCEFLEGEDGRTQTRELMRRLRGSGVL